MFVGVCIWGGMLFDTGMYSAKLILRTSVCRTGQDVVVGLSFFIFLGSFACIFARSVAY